MGTDGCGTHVLKFVPKLADHWAVLRKYLGHGVLLSRNLGAGLIIVRPLALGAGLDPCLRRETSMHELAPGGWRLCEAGLSGPRRRGVRVQL
jgi:hypothetical protein